MNATRSRLIALGLVRPDTSANKQASMARAIAARRTDLQRKTIVTHKGRTGPTGSINNPLAQV